MHGLLQEPPEEHLSLSILSLQNFYGGICLYPAQLSVKLVLCRLSFDCSNMLDQGWANSGPRAKCGPPQRFTWPAEAFRKYLHI